MLEHDTIALKLTPQLSYLALNQAGGSCLTAAANGGYVEVVKMLIDAKANVNQFTNVRYSPIECTHFDVCIIMVVLIDMMCNIASDIRQH